MYKEYDPLGEECTLSNICWSYGRYGLRCTGKKGNYSVCVINPGARSVKRISLKTRDKSVAKKRLIAFAHGFHRDHPGGDPTLVEVVTKYLATLPKVHHHRYMAGMLFPTLSGMASKAKLSDLTKEFQVEIMRDIAGRRKVSAIEKRESCTDKQWAEYEAGLTKMGKTVFYKSNSIAQMMAFISKVTTWATEAHGGVRLSRPLVEKIVCDERAICKLVDGLVMSQGDNYHPDREGMARLIVALQPFEEARRWLLLMLAFGCRVEAACQATSSQLRFGQFDLLGDRKQADNKWRPELPVPPSALAEMRTWGEGAYVGMTAKAISDIIRSVRDEIGLPKLKASSIRDYCKTMFRHAHARHGVRFVHKEESDRWQGHRKQDISERYGEFAPDYMIRSKVATEAELRVLDRLSGGGLFSQGAAKISLDALATQEDVEGERLLEVKGKERLPRDTLVFTGPKRENEGENGPTRGAFRQLSAHFARRPDGTISLLDTPFQPSLEERCRASGFELLEEEPEEGFDPFAIRPIYIVATGAQVIPAANASKLRSVLTGFSRPKPYASKAKRR